MAAPNPTTSLIDDAPLPDLAVGAIVTVCTAKLLLHLFTSVRHYGYFRDELYYLDMARHLESELRVLRCACRHLSSRNAIH